MKIKNDMEKLVEAHWKYIEGMLKVHGEMEDMIKVIGYHYKTAFIHGYKHGVEEALSEELVNKLVVEEE